MKRTSIIPIKWINEGHDSDWDKVPNFRDCQPFNPRKQHMDKYHIKRWHVKSSWYPEVKVEGYQERKKQTDAFLAQKAEDINLISQQMFGKDFTKLTDKEKAIARKTFIWGW